MTTFSPEFNTVPELDQVSNLHISCSCLASESHQIYNCTSNITSTDDECLEISKIMIHSNEVSHIHIIDTSVTVKSRGATPSGPTRQNVPATVVVESSSKSRVYIIRLAVAKMRRLLQWNSNFDQENAVIVSKGGKHFVTFRFKNNVF